MGRPVPSMTRACDTRASVREYLGFITRLRDGGLINSHAYAMGVAVLHAMQTQGQRQTFLSIEQACSKLFSVEGTVIAPPSESSYFSTIEALQSLHFNARIYSARFEIDFRDPSLPGSHFTLSPAVEVGIHWSTATPLVFRIPDYSLHTLEGLVQARLRHFYSTQELVEWGRA